DTAVGAGPIAVHSLDLRAGQLTIANGVTFTLGSNDGATSILTGSVEVNGAFNIDSNIVFRSSVSVDRQGTVAWQHGTITSTNSSMFINAGIFTNQGGTTWTAQDLGSLFKNLGLFIEDNPQTATLALPFNLINGGAPFNVNGTNYTAGTALIRQGSLQ